MKLATALLERSELQKRVNALEIRLCNNARVQEGEHPSENPASLLEELDTDIERLDYLVCKINLTNANTLADGETLTSKLSRRDALHTKIQVLRSFLMEASNLTSRASRSEIKIKSTVKVAELQKKVDAISKELRLLDERIQELNWTTELQE